MNNLLTRTILITATLFFVALSASAGTLVSGGRITKIGNTRSSLDPSFIVFVEGGAGPCANNWLYFYPSGSSNAEIQKRAYAAALLALSTNATVTIEAASTDSCLDAYYIGISQ
jgi:hypothetical protein